MIRLMIKWDFISPALQTVSGIAEVHYVTSPTEKWHLLAKFRVKREPGMIGYKSLDGEGIPSMILDAVKPQLDIMVRSYQQGVIMDKDDFTWIIEDEIDEAREALRKIPDKVFKSDVIFEMKNSDGER